MSYRPTGKSAYAMKRRMMAHLPSLNRSFRSAWESNIDKALARIEELEAQGWTVDVTRGAMSTKQADLLASEAERMGYEVERIPVAEWLDDLAQFVAYKPKEPSVEAAPTLQEPPLRQWKAEKPTREISPEEMLKRYQIEMTRIDRASPDTPDNGLVMSHNRTAAFAAHNATGGAGGLITMMDDLVKKAQLVKEVDVKEAQKRLMLAERDGKKIVAVDGAHYNVRFVKGALTVFGKGKVNFYVKELVAPVVIKNQRGDRIAIAPDISSYPPEEIVNIT